MSTAFCLVSTPRITLLSLSLSLSLADSSLRCPVAAVCRHQFGLQRHLVRFRNSNSDKFRLIDLSIFPLPPRPLEVGLSQLRFSFPLFSLPLPFPSLSLCPLNSAKGLGSAVSSPSGVWGESPSKMEFSAF